MSQSLADLCAPAHTALITSECQEGIVGELSPVKALVDEVRRGGVLERICLLVAAARREAVPVVHCTVIRRPDQGGASTNCRLLAFAARAGDGGLVPGSPAARLAPGLGPAAGDYVMPRLHGVSPFHGTELDPVLRNLGVRTVVATGVSLNVALLGLTFEAVNRGYRVVLPRDATAGVPPDYVDALFRHTLDLLATIASAEEIVAAWERGRRDAPA